MSNLQRLAIVICAVFLASLPNAAMAQEVPYYSRTYLLAGWELNEMKDSNDAFMGFWAIPRMQLSVGNIRRMWIEPVESGGWDAFAFEPVQANAKLNDLVAQGMSMDSAAVFQSREDRAQTQFSDQDIDGGAQGFITKGFISGDPLAETAGSMNDPSPMIDLLADVNYPVAPGLTNMMVSGTAGANVTMNPDTGELLSQLAGLVGIGDPQPCVCTTHTNSFFGDWVFTGISPGHNSGVWICTYSRSYYQGVWYTGQHANCTSCDEGSSSDPAETNYVASQIEEIIVTEEDCDGIH